ncbi:HTH-type transcriptional repressor AseR [compost metagenome]
MSSSLHHKIKTVVSPFHELLCCLHVLTQPGHHPGRLAWATAALQQLSAGLADEIREIGRVSDDWTALHDLADAWGRSRTCEEGIQELLALPDAELVHLMLNGKVPVSTVLLWMKGERGLTEEGLEADGIDLLENLDSFRLRLAATLRKVEAELFRDEWKVIEPFLQAAAGDFLCEADRSPERALNSLHPRLRAEKGTITAQKARAYLFDYETLEHIYIFPSTFIAPHLLLGIHGNDVFLPLAVEIPGPGSSDSPPADLLLRYKALSDETRLRIIRLLWRNPHCTKQLAPILGISEAAVSKHLKLLSEAGLVQSRRRGSYQFYSAVKEELEMLIVLQRQYLEQ